MQKMNNRELFQHYCNQIIAQNKDVLEDQDVIDFIRCYNVKTEAQQDLFNQASLVLMATHQNMTINQRIDRIDTCMMFFEAMEYSGIKVLLMAVMNDFKDELEKKSTFLQQAQGLTKQ